MQSSFNVRLAYYGLWTYRVAWILEIVAATIGLTTGLALGYQAYQASQGSEFSIGAIDLTLASAPFLMVALAELIKIPIATLLFSASWLWKPLLAMFLAILALITFETVFLGLERASAQRQLAYEEVRSEIATRRVDLAALEARLARAASGTEIADIQSEIERTLETAARELAEKQAEIERVQTQIDGIKLRNPEYASLTKEMESVQLSLQDTLEQRRQEFQTFGEPFERQRDSYVQRIEQARQQDDQGAVERYTRELGALRNPIPGINQRFEPEIARLEDVLRELRGRQRVLAGIEAVEERTERLALEQRRATLEDERVGLDVSWRERSNAAMDRLSAAQKRTSALEAEGEDLRARAAELSNEIAGLEKDRIRIARTDQVRRLAAWIYGRAPENVVEEEAALVALFWFGSLGVLAALAGPLTAIVALGLQRTAEIRENDNRRPLTHYLRRWLLSWRFKRVRKVPFPVEVPLDRIVEKTVEVPVEKLVKEILYVPIFTDDPEALKRTLERDLPEEIADLVKLKYKGAERGSAA